MKRYIDFIFITFILLFLSCQKNDQNLMLAGDAIFEEEAVFKEEEEETEVDSSVEITEDEPDEEPLEEGTYEIKNGSIYYVPTPEEVERMKKQREAFDAEMKEKAANKNPSPFYEEPEDRWGLKDIVRDFSAFDIHPLEKFLGKWIYLDYYGNKHKRGSYIEIYKENLEYKYNYNRGYANEEGWLHYKIGNDVSLWCYRDSEYTFSAGIVGDLITMNNSKAFFLAYEWPIGYFQLESDSDNDFSAWPTDYINGSWIGEYELIDGTPIEKKRYSWGSGFSLLNTSTEVDLGRKKVMIPGHGDYEVISVFRDEEGSVCLAAVPMEEETQEGQINFKITFLDHAKAYITHDKWELWDDKRYSPEENWPWYRLSGPEWK